MVTNGIVNRPIDLHTFKKQGLRLFDIQPVECRQPLNLDNNNAVKWKPVPKRIFFFDPTPLYEKINEAKVLNPYQRQCTVSINFLFDNKGLS